MEELIVEMPAWAVKKIKLYARVTGKSVDEVCAFFLGLEVVHT